MIVHLWLIGNASKRKRKEKEIGSRPPGKYKMLVVVVYTILLVDSRQTGGIS